MGGSSSSVAGSAFLGSLGFLGGPNTSGGGNAINSLDQTTTLKSSPATVNTQYANMGNAPQNFNPLTAPQFYNGETSGPFKFLGKVNDTGNNNGNNYSPNYLEYILIIGGAVILVVIIAKKDNNSE